MSVYDLITNALPKEETNWALAPNIPKKKLNGACSAIADVKPGEVVAVADSTIFGSAKEGIVLTGAAFYWRDGQGRFSVGYDDIASIEVVEEVRNTSEGDKRELTGICFTTKSGEKKQTRRVFTVLHEVDYKQLKSLIEQIISLDSAYESVDTTIPLAAEEFPIKKAYVEILAALAMDKDGVIDSREYAHIIQLMTRIELNRRERFDIREQVLGEDYSPDAESSIASIREAIPEPRMPNVRISIMKDAINLFRAQNDQKGYEVGSYKKSQLLVQLRESLGISDERMSLIEGSIETDLEIMNNRNVTDDQVKRMFTELAGKAGAIGVPLAAVYLTGTVGMSAAGVTSGLAALGMGGVLGFSGMVTGIGVAILLGVVSYKYVGVGIKKLTGDDSDQYREREFLLQQVVKTTQRTIQNVIEDINYITEKLKDAVFSSEQKADQNQQQIRVLTRKLHCVTKASQYLEEQSDTAEKESILIGLPKQLDIARMDYLAKEPIKSDVVEAIKPFYKVSKEKNEQGHEQEIWILDDQLSLGELQFLDESFAAIQYFSASNVLSQNAKEALGSAKDRFNKWLDS